MDDKTAREIRPKLSALITFVRNVSISGQYMPDNETRREYEAMYEDISQTLEDPKLAIYAPPLPHLGTTGEHQTLFADKQVLIVSSGTQLISYLEAQLAQVGPSQQAAKLPIRCFLAHTFDYTGQGYASEVKRFLELLAISVVSGAKFEPRSVSEKILELLDQDLHFGVLIVSDGEESIWSRDEVSRLWAEGKFVIVLVEAGTSFTQGIQGDLEWIPFDRGHVSDAFLKLLEGIEFIRRKVQ